MSSGDPYLAFAIRAGLAPAEATKQTHGATRDLCKTCLLGVNYGMGAQVAASGSHRAERDRSQGPIAAPRCRVPGVHRVG